MTHKEKAKELVDRFLNMEFGILKEYLPNHIIIAKQCALICVDRDIQMIIDFENNDEIGNYWFFDDMLEELYEVKQEIIKL